MEEKITASYQDYCTSQRWSLLYKQRHTHAAQC
jgi:hypothetical protein